MNAGEPAASAEHAQAGDVKSDNKAQNPALNHAMRCASRMISFVRLGLIELRPKDGMI